MATNIEIEITPIEEAIDAIIDIISDNFLTNVDEAFFPWQIETEIAALIDELKEEIYCLIEFPYVDKVYRDSYYNYYSSKHFPYKRDCIRVSLFETEVLASDFLNPDKHVELSQKYLGYFVIRPTVNAVLGRSVINPLAFQNNGFKICSCKTSSLVHGVKLETEGFPHSSQDGETIKCAETTIWSLMEYFGNKYPEYKPALPSQIHRTLERFSYQRQLPSDGLTMDQISFALKDFGFGTRAYSFAPYDAEIYEIVDSYIESGIPVIIGLQSGAVGHVIVAVGKKYDETIDWGVVPKSKMNFRGAEVEYYETTNISSEYVVHDDNLAPYRLISLDNPGAHYEDEDCKKYEIDSAVVPLYPKIYLESVVAKQLMFQVLKDANVGFDFGADFVFRFYLTSSRSFKNHIAKLTEMEAALKTTILLTKMPKFIWCAEFYLKDSFNTQDRKSIGLIVLDATEANQESIDALIFAGYPDRCVSLNENNFVTLQYSFVNYNYFSNLK